MNASTRIPGSPKKRDSRRGATAVEVALLMPLFMMLTLGMLDFSRALFVRHALLEAAQAGARVAALPSTSTNDVSTEAHRVLDAASLSGSGIVSSNVGSAGARGATTTVAVTYPFVTLSGQFVPGWNGTVTMTQTAFIRHE